eukprot:g10299.t1 g10299   contig4:1602664-1603989(+)
MNFSFLALCILCLVPDKSKFQASASTDDDTTSPPPTFTLSNNITIPLIGLGSASGVRYSNVQSAIDVGYKFVDTAQSLSWGYHEAEVGKAIKDAKRRWEDWHSGESNGYVFVQTKIHPQDLGYGATKKAIQLSLERMEVTSLDSVLIHKPRCWEGICTREPEGTWEDSWVALEEAVHDGTVRSIGICDVDNSLLDQLLTKRIGPTIIQNWFDPFHQDKELRRRIQEINEKGEQKVLYQAYSTLGTQWMMRGYTNNPVLNNPILKSLAKKYSVSVPQVVIQWATRQGVMVLPASRNRSHQESNLDISGFRLSDAEMQSIDALDGHPSGKIKPNGRLGRKQDGGRSSNNPNEVGLQLVNKAKVPLDVFWVPEGADIMKDEGDHVKVGELNRHADVLNLNSYHGHVFVFKEHGKSDERVLNHFVVDKGMGGSQHHEIKDRSGEL